MPPAPDLAALVRRRTRLQAPPVVPELRLHLADDLTAAWEDLERELAAGQLPPPFWAFAWVGGQALARYVLDRPAEVADLRVLDLCTGSGLVALAARAAGAREVVGVDIDPVAGAAFAANAAANGLEVEFRCTDLTAGPSGRGDEAGDGAPEFDVLLAGDVCYDREMTDRVMPWLRSAAARGARVLLGDPGRHYLPQQGLVQVAGLDIPTTRDLEGVEVKHVRVFAVDPA